MGYLHLHTVEKTAESEKVRNGPHTGLAWSCLYVGIPNILN